MREDRVTILNQLGLHARAAAQLVRLAGTFTSRIKLRRVDNGVVADAKSILSVLTLAASKGTTLTVEIDGEDEDAASEAVQTIFANGFGEL